MSFHFVEGAVIADRFCLVRKLGQGGMGEVWLARHLALEGFCAIKLIDPAAAASPDLRSRFVFEGKAAARIRSAHVVQILDIGFHKGSPFIVMEHLDGEDLRTRLVRDRVIDAGETASIVTQVARALTRAHAAGIIHRDLKPGNLFLCREGDREIVKVLDFGVAKHMAGAAGFRTAPDTLLGTLQYMSPEQVQRAWAVDHRADLWALGVIAFRCLTGELPFKGTAGLGTLEQVVAGPIPVPSTIAPVPNGFDLWWARVSSRDPDGRFQSAKDLATSLHMALDLSGPLDLAEPDLGRTVKLGVRLPIHESHGPLLVVRPVVPASRPAPPIHALGGCAYPPMTPLVDGPSPPMHPPAQGVASPLDALLHPVASPTRASMERAPSRGSSSPTAGPFATSIRPAATAMPRAFVRARIVAVVAIMALGGLAAVSVSLGSSVSAGRTLARSNSSAPTGPLPVLLTVDAVSVPAADKLSVMPAAAVSLRTSAPSVRAASRTVVPRPPVKPPAAAPARRPPEPTSAPISPAHSGEPPFDPGI